MKYVLVIAIAKTLLRPTLYGEIPNIPVTVAKSIELSPVWVQKLASFGGPRAALHPRLTDDTDERILRGIGYK